jgi:hypothetical protein
VHSGDSPFVPFLGNVIAHHNQLLWFGSNGQPIETSQIGHPGDWLVLRFRRKYVILSAAKNPEGFRFVDAASILWILI